VTSPAFRLRLPACRILGGYTVEDGRVLPRVGYRQALEPALARCRPVVALMTAGKLLATLESLVAQAVPPANFIPSQLLSLVDAWADAEAAAALAVEAARMSDRLDAAHADVAQGVPSGPMPAVSRLVSAPAPVCAAAESAVIGAAARLFATAHAASAWRNTPVCRTYWDA